MRRRSEPLIGWSSAPAELPEEFNELIVFQKQWELPVDRHGMGTGRARKRVQARITPYAILDHIERYWVVSGLLVFVAVASVVTAPARSAKAGQPLLQGSQADNRVLLIFERSCCDCHSERTQYPWYSFVAPLSWWVRRDVTKGKARLNLSLWNEYPMLRKERNLSEIANQVKDRDMPLREYLWLHPGARLSDSDIDTIFLWTQEERLRLIGLGR